VAIVVQFRNQYLLSEHAFISYVHVAPKKAYEGGLFLLFLLCFFVLENIALFLSSQ
jgi:hypothetical protein